MVAAAIALVESGGELRVLLCRTSSGRRFTFPKGDAEGRETANMAARREAEEETGFRMVGESVTLTPYQTEKGLVTPVLFKNAYLSRQGEREGIWFPLEIAATVLKTGRSPEEGAAMAGALWRAVARYRDPYASGDEERKN